MTIQTNTTDRKALAKAIAEALHTEYRYLRTPTYAYEVGGYTIDRYGNLIGDDFTPIHDLLVANGYIEAEPETTTEAVDADAPVEEEAPVEETGAEPSTESTEDESDADSEEEQTPADGKQRITMPAPDMTVEQLRNLTYILYSRQNILNLMTRGKTICIPTELIEALQEALPATPEDFTRLMNIFKPMGLKGYDFRDGEFSLTFPLYEAEPSKLETYAGLQGRILQMARTATRVFPELMIPEEEAEKYTAHMWLQRMGYKGPEMKKHRDILLKHLHGYCAFSNGAKMQKHKDKYSVIRRERREAERAAGSVTETFTPTAEAKAPAVETAMEVAVNE